MQNFVLTCMIDQLHANYLLVLDNFYFSMQCLICKEVIFFQSISNRLLKYFLKHYYGSRDFTLHKMFSKIVIRLQMRNFYIKLIRDC